MEVRVLIEAIVEVEEEDLEAFTRALYASPLRELGSVALKDVYVDSLAIRDQVVAFPRGCPGLARGVAIA